VINGRLRAAVRPLVPAALRRRWRRAVPAAQPDRSALHDAVVGRYDAAWVRRHSDVRRDVDDRELWGLARSARRPLSPFDDGMLDDPVWSQVVATADAGERPVLRFGWRPPSAAELRVCVHVHTFYVDLLDELLPSLRHLPPNSLLMLSVVTPEAQAAAQASVDRHLGTMWPRRVVLVENRGRNFLPLLTTFADHVAAHDVVLHVHTKKSLYSGREQMEWRTHLTRALCATPAALGAALSLFEKYDDVGLLFADRFPGLPVWGSHWLGNHVRGAELLERMGATNVVPHGYLQYPTGGMFWARASALAPLLSARLSADDFEDEAGQTDRTMAHAVERCVAVSARLAGMRSVEFAYDSAQWRLDWTNWGDDRFGAIDVESLRARVAAATLLSVDLFDTLDLRPVTRAEVLQRRAFRSVTGNESEANAAFDARRSAEASLRSTTPVGDVTLDEIYQRLAATTAWTPDRIDALRSAELDAELRAVTPRHDIVDVVRNAHAAGKRVVVMTDTCLPRHTIDALLLRIGLGGSVDEVYVSNEIGARKDDGRMWEHVMRSEDVGAGEWLHLGDHEVSDLQQASDHGARWGHVFSPSAIAQVRGVALRTGEQGVGSSDTIAGIGVVPLLCAHAADPLSDAEGFGRYVVGPIALAFAMWARVQAAEHDRDELWFVARDGWLLDEVYRRLASVVPGTSTPSRYVLSSRVSMIGAAHGDVIDADLILGTREFRGTFAELLANCTGYPVADRSIGDVYVDLPRDTGYARALLAFVADDLSDYSRLRADAYRGYVSALGIDDRARLGIVDIGYSASSLRGLARIIPNDLVGLFAVTTPNAPLASGSRLSVHAAFGERRNVGDGHFILDNARLFEAALSEPVEQFAGCAVEDGVPVKQWTEGTRPSQATAAAAARVRQGVHSYLDKAFEVLHPAELLDPIDPVLVLDNVAEAASRLCDMAALRQQLFIADRHESVDHE
jgi:FMN phosphatase YigB (HAD superfamily)